jgi:hypothetical protein
MFLNDSAIHDSAMIFEESKMKINLIVASLLAAGVSLAETVLPVWFDTFQEKLKAQAGWQSFRAAYQLDYVTGSEFTGGQAMTVKMKFTPQVREGIVIWRFPDVQMKKFRIRVKVPAEAREVYLRMVTNDTKGDAAFFKPWNNGKNVIDLPVHTVEGQKSQPASPLPNGEWITYEVTMPDDVFYEQKKQKAAHAVHDFALMNTGRDQLKLSAESRPATEAFFISFGVQEDSPLFGRDLEILVDLAEIY